MTPVSTLDLDPALSKRRTAADYVADSLRAAIYRGDFEDGQELNQVQLANHYGVSRVPVREALHRLQAEGLVYLEAHRRAVVIGFSRDRILEIFEVRTLLEGYLLECAAPRIDEAALRGLRRLCDEMDTTEDHDEWLTLNRQFHAALYASANSTTALPLVEQLTSQVERYLRRTERGIDRQRDAGQEHRRIVEALEQGRPTEAREALQTHISQTRDLVSARLADVSAAADAADVPRAAADAA